jgi:hypothetical protein
MDWTARSSASNHRKIEKNQKSIEKGKMGSREKWECGNKIVVRVDEFRKIDGEMGIAI